MSLANLFGWSQKHAHADKPEEQPTACGAADKSEEQPTACGAADKPEEKPSACGSACGAGDA